MRTTQWAVGMIVVGVLAGTTACGGSEVIVRPVGGSTAVSDAADQLPGISIGADGASITDGQGASVSIGADGARVTDGQGAGVSIGADGAKVTDGQGAGVSLGANGASVSAGSSSGGSSTGTVELAGAVSVRGDVTGGCHRLGPQSRQIYVQPDDQTMLAILVDNPTTASVSLVQGTRSWDVNHPGNAGDVLTVGDGSVQLRGVQLVGSDGTVDLTASFNC